MHTSLSIQLKKLLDLTSKKNADAVKELLETESTETKGPLFENFLVELYKVIDLLSDEGFNKWKDDSTSGYNLLEKLAYEIIDASIK